MYIYIYIITNYSCSEFMNIDNNISFISPLSYPMFHYYDTNFPICKININIPFTKKPQMVHFYPI